MQIRWCSGIRFKMAFETEDSSRISWFMGTVCSVQAADSLWWPHSPWRLLQVTWDEPDLLQNVKRVSPWLVELASNMAAIHFSPFSITKEEVETSTSTLIFPSTVNFRCRYFPAATSLDPAVPLIVYPPTLLLACREPGMLIMVYHYQITSINCKLVWLGLVSRRCWIILLHSLKPQTSKPFKRLACVKKYLSLLLFGQPILAEQQISLSCTGNAASPVLTGNSSSEGNLDKMANFSDGSVSTLHRRGLPESSSCEELQWNKDNHRKSEPSFETGHCKVFLDSEDVGRTLDLSLLGSYEELYRKLADMFGLRDSEKLSNVLYRDVNGITKHIGEELFSDFFKTARRLTIVTDSSSGNVGI
uniref:PB1 domain-containing protein n=2 Tax=Salix viminalis TaxID=40686 RepID=A0A6N2KXN8_SALVM